MPDDDAQKAADLARIAELEAELAQSRGETAKMRLANAAYAEGQRIGLSREAVDLCLDADLETTRKRMEILARDAHNLANAEVEKRFRENGRQPHRWSVEAKQDISRMTPAEINANWPAIAARIERDRQAGRREAYTPRFKEGSFEPK